MKKSNYIHVSRTEKNQDSGNHCIGYKQLFGSGKSFKFEFEDGTYSVVSHQLVYDYVKNNPGCWKTGCWVTDSDGDKKWIPALYILIPDDFIISNAA